MSLLVVIILVTATTNLHVGLKRSSIVWSMAVVSDSPKLVGGYIHEPPRSNISLVPNTMIHRAEFGLGHRLLRTATVWHLAQQLGIAKVNFQWNKCEDKEQATNKNGTKIFQYLFGKDEWWLPNFTSTQQYGKSIVVPNDVLGYLPTQTFLDHQIPLQASVYRSHTGPFLSKIASDTAFYQQLADRFLFKDTVNEFMDLHKFREHQVIGIHLRAGNGEKNHFLKAGRGIANETSFVRNLVDLIATHLVGPSSSSSLFTRAASRKRPPLFFVATDTSYLLPIISNLTHAMGITTVVFPQIRLAANQGVTFAALVGAGEKCLRGWQAMFIDMMLLSQSDILVAARHSSFTQSMPLPLVMERKQYEKGPHFCEVSVDAAAMSCFQDLPAWLFRDTPEHEWTYVLSSAGHLDAAIPVHHKSMIHLPEDEPLRERLLNFVRQDDGRKKITYGRRFNPKYRKQKSSDHPGWNFT
jgi:hypothetical protein